MGTCYSTHSRPINISTAEMPHDSSVSLVPGAHALQHPGDTLAPPAPAGPASAQFGFRKPYGGRYGKASNSNEQSGGAAAGERSPLGTVPDAPRGPGQSAAGSARSSTENIDSAPKRFGFGFKAPTTTTTASTASKRVADKTPSGGASEESLQPGKQQRLVAYDPRDKHASLESWRMIDDSSTAGSMSSGGDRASRRTEHSERSEHRRQPDVEEEGKEGKHSLQSTPTSNKSASSEATLTGNSRKSSASNGIGAKPAAIASRLQSRLRGPLAKFYASKSVDKGGEKAPDNWVRASSTAAAGEAKAPAAAATAKAAQPQQTKKSGGVPAFLRRGLLKKQKSAPVEPHSGAGKSAAKSSHGKEKEVKVSASEKAAAAKGIRSQGVSTGEPAVPGTSTPAPAARNTEAPGLAAALALNGGARRMFDIPPGKAPIAMIDSVETTSIGSINSDDLMLETDIPLDDYEELGPVAAGEGGGGRRGDKPRSRKNSRTRPRSRSRSRDSLDAPVGGETAVAGRKSAAVLQRSISDTRGGGLVMAAADGGQRRGGARSVHVPASLDLPDTTENEPLQELASLLDKNNAVPRRNPRLHRAARPASFPGWRPAGSVEGEAAGSGGGSAAGTPTGSSTTPTDVGGKVLRPPRQPSIDESEPIELDAYTYRHIMQDVTQYKTLLHKLKRKLQDDEIGTPIGQTFNQSWGSKNGFKPLGGSQPGSPYCPEDKRFSFGEKDASPAAAGASLEEVMQENAELRHQLQALQHQVEEQDRTIRLLQQQMTKYECGHVGPGGTSFTHSGSQTDKPRLPISKSVFESGNSRRVESSESQPVVRYRTELSSSLRLTNDQAGKEETDEDIAFEPESGIEGHHVGQDPDDVTSEEELTSRSLDTVDNARTCRADSSSNAEEEGMVDHAERGPLAAIDGADDSGEDSTDKDVQTFTSSSSGAPRERLVGGAERLCTSDTMTSITEDLVSSLSSPSSDLDGLSSGSPVKLPATADAAGLLTDAELRILTEELEAAGPSVQSTPVAAARLPGNVTFVADVATPDSDGAGSMHDFNVQAVETLESFTARALGAELLEAEHEEEEERSAATDPSSASPSLATVRRPASGRGPQGRLNATFTRDQNGGAHVSSPAANLNGTFTVAGENGAVNGGKPANLNSTFTKPAAPAPEQAPNMVRSETHSSGYQSDVMVASTTSSDVMATSATSGDVMVSSTGSGTDADNNNLPESAPSADPNRNAPSQAKPRLIKPRYSGLQQKPKLATLPKTDNNNKAERPANRTSDEGVWKAAAGRERRQMVPPGGGRGRSSGLQPPKVAASRGKSPTHTSAAAGTVKPGAPAEPAAAKPGSKLPSALPRPGKIPTGPGGGSAAKPHSSKLPAYGGKRNLAGGRNSQAGVPAKASARY